MRRRSIRMCLPMDFTGRPMKGYVYVTGSGMDTDDELECCSV